MYFSNLTNTIVRTFSNWQMIITQRGQIRKSTMQWLLPPRASLITECTFHDPPLLNLSNLSWNLSCLISRKVGWVLSLLPYNFKPGLKLFKIAQLFCVCRRHLSFRFLRPRPHLEWNHGSQCRYGGIHWRKWWQNNDGGGTGTEKGRRGEELFLTNGSDQ